jgi:AcrR family transcriptional regulator
MDRSNTKQRLLDVAERLFADSGYHCTSLRKITAEAGVNLAAVSYHFGSKEALVEAIFERRLRPLNEERVGRLMAVRVDAEAAGQKPTVEEALRAFIEPTLHFRDSAPGARYFLHLIGRALTEPDDAVRSIFYRMIGPVFALMFEVLCETQPNLDRNQVFWRLNFAFGAIARCTFLPEKLPVVPPGVDPALSAERQIEMLVDFLVAGMEAS